MQNKDIKEAVDKLKEKLLKGPRYDMPIVEYNEKLALLEKVKEINILSLKPDDVVVVKLNAEVSTEDAKIIGDYVKLELGLTTQKVIVSIGVDLVLIRSEEWGNANPC